MLRPRLARLFGAAILAATPGATGIGHRHGHDPDDPAHAPARDQARLRARRSRTRSRRSTRTGPSCAAGTAPAGVDDPRVTACGGPSTRARATSSRRSRRARRIRFADFRIRTGHTYHYLVAGIGTDGTRVAKSKRVTVRVARPAELLRFNCVFLIDDARQRRAAAAGRTPLPSRRRALRAVALRRRRPA